ncbi:cytochrome c oxidase assembly protein [Gordonia amicalis]|uniref:cytochrome c oxidase assembly protein n=1 Tax=Gordonia amicalis TaxID=89053 RepID=UPI00286FC4CB|nr:cytochrome c oxidase assembly protein [Gordonia amicalis]
MVTTPIPEVLTYSLAPHRPQRPWSLQLALPAIVYLIAAQRCHRQPRGWNHWRTASFIVGLIILGMALRPSTSDSFQDHMLGHLLLGMFAPLALVLGAPMTLALRTTPASVAKPLVHLLRSRPARITTHPAVLLIATVGGLAALYFTPLFTLTERHGALHMVVHAHFFVGGYLFAWMIAGPDPGPDRPSVRMRLVVLGLAILGHAVIAQLLYAGLFVAVDAPPDELRAGGTLMYYWGDIAEILLALALLLTWRPDHRGFGARSRARNDPGRCRGARPNSGRQRLSPLGNSGSAGRKGWTISVRQPAGSVEGSLK